MPSAYRSVATRRVLACTAVAVTVLGCSKGDSAYLRTVPPAKGFRGAADATRGGEAAPPSPPPTSNEAGPTAAGLEKMRVPSMASDSTPSITPSLLIRTGQASIEVTSVGDAVAKIRQLAQRADGYIANSSMEGGVNTIRSATLELKIPAARFDQAIGGLQAIGSVEVVNIKTEDVGEEFVDVNARLANDRRLEQRLLDLLAQRTGKLSDVLAVEAALARVREEIERYQGRIRYLRSQSAVSTLTVTVHEHAPILERSVGRNPLGEAFKTAWRNFVGFVAGFIASLGILIPLGVLLFLGWVVYKRVLRTKS